MSRLKLLPRRNHERTHPASGTATNKNRRSRGDETHFNFGLAMADCGISVRDSSRCLLRHGNISIKHWFLNTRNNVRSIKNLILNTKNHIRSIKNGVLNTKNPVRSIKNVALNTKNHALSIKKLQIFPRFYGFLSGGFQFAPKAGKKYLKKVTFH